MAVARFLNCRQAMVTPLPLTASHPHTLEPSQKVVIVNGHPGMLGQLDSQLTDGHYDMVFVESTGRAYTEIRKVLPHLIVLCTHEFDLDACQLLTMLKLDIDTCAIPVMTWTPEPDDQDLDVDTFQQMDDDFEAFPLRTIPAMN